MAVVIDTSVLIDLERRKALNDIDLEALLGEGAALASISVSEMLVGAFRHPDPTQRGVRERYVLNVANRFPILPFALDEARVHGRLGADMAMTGQRIGAHDLIIAGHGNLARLQCPHPQPARLPARARPDGQSRRLVKIVPPRFARGAYNTASLRGHNATPSPFSNV